MKKWVGSAVTLGAFICACSSLTKKETAAPFGLPPGHFPADAASSAQADPEALVAQWNQWLATNPGEEAKLLVDYRSAKVLSEKQPKAACELFLALAENQRFPVARVAGYRALEVCESTPRLTKLSDDLSRQSSESWLRDLAMRSSLERAIHAGDKTAEMRLQMELASSESVQADQIKRLERSLKLARELGDRAFETQAFTALNRAAPRTIANPKPEQYLMVANDLRRARSFDRARELYERVVSSDAFNDNDKLKALDGIRMSYKLEQNREKFLEETRRYAEFAKQKFYTEALKSKKRPGQYAKYLDTRLTLARAIWTENSPREADQILRAVEKDLKGRYPVDESLFIRARIEEEAGRLDQSVKLLDTINDRRVADRALRQKIQWFRAWNLRKVGKLQEASVLLERLVAEEETPSLQARNRFWLGRVLKDLGEKQKADDQFNWLIANDPIGYYGTIAYRELGQSLPSLRGATASRGLASSLLNAKSLMADEETLFSWLVASDEKDLARRYLDSISQQRRGEWNDEQTLEFLQHYARAGAYQSLFARLSETQPETRKQILERQPELIFPRSWKPLIDSAGAKYGVAPELVMSIIRQESSFNPTARSHADAFGLMQLIPEMAKRASASTGVRVEAHEDLYKPETNIPLGTAFLKELFEKWNNRFIPAVASYNASEKAVLGWLKTRDRKDPLQFIEDIPYEETKGYVKLVMRNYVFYSRMNAGAAGVPFPEWCLQGLQDINP